MRWAFVMLSAWVASCSPPYRPFCQLGPEQTLSDSSGVLAAHADGRVSVLTVKLGVAEVRWFTVGGDLVDAFSVDAPKVPLGGTAPVAWPDGVATAAPVRSPDGGFQTAVTLMHRDGGSTEVQVEGMSEVPFLSRGGVLSQVGQTLQLQQGAHFAVLAFDGGVLSRKATTGNLQPLGDAFVEWPGPRLLTESLEPLSVAPSPQVPPGRVAWSRQLGRIANARANQRDLLIDRFDLVGSVEAERRVSSAVGVLAVAVSSAGDAVVFSEAFDQANLWLAFLDVAGQKRGPDLLLRQQLSGSLLAAILQPVGPGRFSLFLLDSSGVQNREIRCE